jgi:hypothetical protein
VKRARSQLAFKREEEREIPVNSNMYDTEGVKCMIQRE